MLGQALLWLSVFAAGLPARSVIVSPGADEPLRIECPLGRTTRIVFPEAMRQLKGPALGSPLNLHVERTKPTGAITVHPKQHPARSTVEFRGAGGVIRLLLESTPAGEASEVSLVRPAPSGTPAPSVEPTPAPPAEPTLVPVETVASTEPVPQPSSAPALLEAATPATLAPAPVPSGPAPAAPTAAPPAPILDLEGILRAQAVSIGRREGLPGQKPMVLVDALRGERWIWLRFALEGGAGERIAVVSWDQGPIPSFVQEPDGKNLRVILQVPRAAVTRRSRVTLEVQSGPIYTFALNSSSLASFFKGLFQ